MKEFDWVSGVFVFVAVVGVTVLLCDLYHDGKSGPPVEREVPGLRKIGFDQGVWAYMWRLEGADYVVLMANGNVAVCPKAAVETKEGGVE